VSVVILTFLIARAQGIKNGELIRQLGFISLFHDIGLAPVAERLSAENHAALGDADRAELETHPEKSALLLATLGIRDAAIQQAVLPHHERRDQSGYPHRRGAGEIHPFAEIVGIADEFNRYLWRSEIKNVTELTMHFRSQVSAGFSLATLSAFDEAI